MEMANRTFIPRARQTRFSYSLTTGGVPRDDVVEYLEKNGVKVHGTLHLTPGEAARVNSLLYIEFSDGARVELND